MADFLDTGIHHGVPEARYHSDPCAEPSLSNSIAKLLVRQSPLHERVVAERSIGEIMREAAELLGVPSVS